MIELVKELAYAAGQRALAARRTMRTDAVHIKATVRDLVTDIDRQIESFIVDGIRAKFPDHAIFGEETGRSVQEHEYCWIIDPIDGTASFVHDYPFYSVSIALAHRGEVIAGAVYGPRFDELFWAEKGKGAFLNGEPIHCSDCTSLNQAMVATGFACLRAELPKNNMPVLNYLMPRIQGLRRDGSAALDLCFVGCGRLDGYWELALAPYDVAAGALIAQEAGARVTDFAGGPNFPEDGTLAAASGVFDEFLRELQTGMEAWNET